MGGMWGQWAASQDDDAANLNCLTGCSRSQNFGAAISTQDIARTRAKAEPPVCFQNRLRSRPQPGTLGP